MLGPLGGSLGILKSLSARSPKGQEFKSLDVPKTPSDDAGSVTGML